MRKRDRRALCGYVREIADKLELRDWTICIGHEPCTEGLAAEIHCTDGAKQARITFSFGFRDKDPEEQRETVVHELIHAQHATCWHMVQSDLSEALGKPTYYLFCDSYRRGMEHMVDALAKAIAPHMPLVEWPD